VGRIIMRKKMMVPVFIVLMAVIYFAVSAKVTKETSIDPKTKQQIESNVNTYLMKNENLKNDVPESLDIKFDKKSDMYIVTVKFQNAPKKMNILISKESIGTK
jgi:hypothetical protein